MSEETAQAFQLADTVEDALTALANGARPIAGGTDLMVGARQGKAPLPLAMVAIDRIPELGEIGRLDDGGLRIGATATHARLLTDDTVLSDYTALADGAALIGSPATRNAGTLGGNVMNGSPAMDTGAPLVVFGASAELTDLEGVRSIPVAELWTGPGRTTAGPTELCTAITLPPRPDRSGSGYIRLEYRRAMEIAVVGAAAAITLAADDVVQSLNVALTAVGPTILGVDGLEDLSGRPVDGSLLDSVAERASAAARPIDDLRAGSDYRRHVVGVMARRAFDAAVRRARGEAVGVPINRTEGVGADMDDSRSAGSE